ncbi:DUF1194 domain-containing protein [Acetobacteraceae bacterium]|nr:DUF1194 domain-containing protein [Candidatus Parcubacteria bacterium]
MAVRCLRAIVALCCLCVTAQSEAADLRRVEVDVAIVLAVDVSGSIQEPEWVLQKDGYAEAFRNPQVLEAIKRGFIGTIAVTMVQWADDRQHKQVIPWTLIGDEYSARRFSDAILMSPRESLGSNTYIQTGIRFSIELLNTLPFDAMRRVIDVSGDGTTNGLTIDLEKVRKEAAEQHITINGLPILEEVPNLDVYYKTSVIAGPGAFMVVAKDFESFAVAVHRKLLLEIASR